jgi:hypothetical protein
MVPLVMFFACQEPDSNYTAPSIRIKECELLSEEFHETIISGTSTSRYNEDGLLVRVDNIYSVKTSKNTDDFEEHRSYRWESKDGYNFMYVQDTLLWLVNLELEDRTLTFNADKKEFEMITIFDKVGNELFFIWENKSGLRAITKFNNQEFNEYGLVTTRRRLDFEVPNEMIEPYLPNIELTQMPDSGSSFNVKHQSFTYTYW